MIKIKEWSKYQSYKDRRPPWIRFHRTILDNYKYQSMSAESRALLPMLWLLACEDEDPTSGLIKQEIHEISFRLRQEEDVINKCLKELQAVDFIECNEPVTKPYKKSNDIVTTETETETKAETKTDSISEFNLLWSTYEKKGNKKKSLQRFKKLKKKEIDLIKIHVPKYVLSTPDKQYRKNFETYLFNECWNDEIVERKETPVESWIKQKDNVVRPKEIKPRELTPEEQAIQDAKWKIN